MRSVITFISQVFKRICNTSDISSIVNGMQMSHESEGELLEYIDLLKKESKRDTNNM